MWAYFGTPIHIVDPDDIRMRSKDAYGEQRDWHYWFRLEEVTIERDWALDAVHKGEICVVFYGKIGLAHILRGNPYDLGAMLEEILAGLNEIASSVVKDRK